MEQLRLHLTIIGRVQGVTYRASAQQLATALGLTGWVRNCINGNVEIVAEGNSKQLAQLVEWAKIGPAYASVQKVITEQSVAQGEFNGFLIHS
jgi:acylphosphatase